MTNELLDNQYTGKILLDLGFEDWFKYLFRVIEGTPFINEPIHQGLFDYFDKVYKGQVTRLNINVPPRSGKTTLAKYFLVFCLTKNPKSNIIYTSYSQSLLSEICNNVAQILEHPIYKSLYPTKMAYESEKVNPIDDFWREYLSKDNGKDVYLAKKIRTKEGGLCFFSSIGSQITGYGCGIRGGKGFGGFLCIDDANKPADIYSDVLRNKVIQYFSGTLLSRLNNSSVPIINIQQRLHTQDLSAVLIDKYNFVTLKRPLIFDGVCQLPKQYSPERIEEIKLDELTFLAQYQQEPTEWINDAFKGIQWATDEETKLIFNGISHVDKGFDGTDGTAFTIGDEKYGTIYLFGKLWEKKHIDDCLTDITFYRNQFKSGTNWTEKNDDKGYMGKNYPNTAIYQESMNKHFKIMTYLYPNWKRIKFIKGTDEGYIRQIQGYSEKAKHDDAPDSAASLIRILKERTVVIGQRPF